MCFFLKDKIKKFFSKKKMNGYENYLHEYDDKLKLRELLIKQRNDKRLEDIITYETNRLYIYPEFIR